MNTDQHRWKKRTRTVLSVLLCIPLWLTSGCSKPANEVVLYTSVDEPFARPIIDRFQKQTGIHVTLVTDTEATKTAGLAERLLAEKDHPQADVFWNNEVFHTINLAEQNIFTPYKPKAADDIPGRWLDARSRYTPLGLRARMIAISTRPENTALTEEIRTLSDLTNPALKGKIALSNPAFGTASGHIAALFITLGEPGFSNLMKGLRANDLKLVGGNSIVADQVAAGTLLAGPTDNDDIASAQSNAAPIEARLPDQGPDGRGTLLIPCTLSLVAQSPHPDQARQLLDFLASPDVEQELLQARFLAFSTRHADKVKSLSIDYVECAHMMKSAVETALQILQDR